MVRDFVFVYGGELGDISHYVDWETGRHGDWETWRLGDMETGRLGDMETRRHEDWGLPGLPFCAITKA